jgi:sulfate adenylyltransferase
MSRLIAPHGGKGLVCTLLEGADAEAEKTRAEGLKKIEISPRENGDLIMMGIGAFSPLDGFMTKADWKGVCEDFLTADGTFWPVPVTLSASKEDADAINEGDEVALFDPALQEIRATMKVTEKYEMTEADKKWECEKIFMGEGVPDAAEFWKIATDDHPGVEMVMNQKDVNLAGPVKVLSEGEFPTKYAGIYMRPAESRKIFEERGWTEIAAMQLRNPMHRSHEYLCKIAVEVCDGVFIHSLVGNLKPGDIPADTRVKCIDTLVKNYFVEDKVLQGGYPMDMRYAGPREGPVTMPVWVTSTACLKLRTFLIRSLIFDKIPYPEEPGKALLCKPLKIDWTFYCYKCDGMASLRTCPHAKDDRVLLSGTMLRKMLSEGGDIPDHFGRDEVLTILRAYYEGLTEKVEIKLHGAATGE